MRRPIFALTLTALLPLLAIACGGDENADREIVRPDISSLPAGSVEQPRQPGELIYELPAGWEEETPSSGMRLAQARVPGADGSGGDAELAVFYFGPGQGGSAQANIDRWLGMVDMGEGEEPIQETFEQGDLTIHTVEARGAVTGSPTSMTGGGAPSTESGAMLLGAVVEGPGGPWFLKLTGPASTVGAAKDDFYRMLRALDSRLVERQPAAEDADA
jgi:hypothetical protein